MKKYASRNKHHGKVAFRTPSRWKSGRPEMLKHETHAQPDQWVKHIRKRPV